MEIIIQTLIYVHAGLGGVALLSGGIAIAGRKGSSLHRKTGKVFYYSMLASALISLIVALMPKHENSFLFAIGVFSTYFLISGYRSIKLKRQGIDLRLDRLIAWGIISTGLLMILYPILINQSINIVMLVFGLVALLFGIRDIRLLKDPQRMKAAWLKLHLGKMTGGYIAATTAFLVVNEILPGIWNWFTPGVLGGVYITYWMLKLKSGKSRIARDSR